MQPPLPLRCDLWGGGRGGVLWMSVRPRRDSQRYMLEPVWNVSMQDMRPCTNSSKPVGQRYRCVLLL
jgi:hypothetical protein